MADGAGSSKVQDREAALSRTLARHPRALGGDTARALPRAAVSLTDMVINNASGRVEHAVPKRKPPWLRARVPSGPGYERLKAIVSEHRLHTVCEEAGCPNMGECWGRGVATIMILGDTCTRACGFCNVKTGRPPTLDRDEPRRVAESLRLMALKHVVITSVNRDELPDGGAGIWAETIVRTRDACPGMTIEVLVPDFLGDLAAVQMVIDARPDIIAHNLETVRRMHPAVRPSAQYERSIDVLRHIKSQGVIAKTGIMVGIGERDDEVLEAMRDVVEGTRVPAADAQGPASRAASCEILTIGQYLQPTRNHLPVERFVTPEQFERYRAEGLALGFKVVESGPLVRSSYHADHQADVLARLRQG
ncbi:MAG: lipoyl synthase [Phycisphaerales bacterium]